MNKPDEQNRVVNPKEAVEKAEPAKQVANVPAPASADDVQDSELVSKYVTRLTPLEEQVGMHVITALQHPKTLAVLTTVAADGGGSQQVVSIPLDAQRFAQIQQLLSATKKTKKRRVQCVGFHCHFENEEADDVDDAAGNAGAETE